MLLPERFPKMLPLNGGFRYPASVMCVTVSKMQTVIKTITIDDTDRFANNILVFRMFRVLDFSFVEFSLTQIVKAKNTLFT